MKTVTQFLFIVLLSATSFIVVAQNRTTDTSATCIAFWKNKDTRVYQIKHTKEKTDLVKGKSISAATYEAHLKVIDSTAAGFTIEWVYKNFTTSGASEQTLNSLHSIMEGLKIIYKTDDVGSFSELVNWQQVRDFAISSYEKALAGKPQTKEFVAGLNQVKAIFQSKENIQTVLIKEVQLFHSPYGIEYSTGGTIVATELPNVTGGTPFPATVTLMLNELNKKQDYCKISLNQVIDKGKAGPIMSAMLKKLSSTPIKDEAEIDKQIKDMEMTDINQFTFAISSGWLNRIFYSRTTIVASLNQVESYEITEKK
jgi:hypothetical protein